MKKFIVTICCVVVLLSFVVGCQVTGDQTTDGALTGAVIGGVAGQLFGGDTKGTLMGAAVGAAAGGLYGHQKKQTDATNQRMSRLEQQANTVIVQVTNRNGSIIDVRLTKADSHGGFYGPRGEYYPSLPTQDQLRPVYGF